MLWIKVVSALESALLLTSSASMSEAPRTRGRGRHSAGPAAPPGQTTLLGPGDAAADGASLLRAINETGPVLPGWGLTESAYPPPPVRHALAFSRLSSTPGGPPTSLPPLHNERRTVWTQDLLRAAGNLTKTDWEESRPLLGDAQWTSAGVAAWWAVRHAIDVEEAASLLHRARARAYGAVDAAGSLQSVEVNWAHADASERTLLKAWVQTRTNLAGIVGRQPSKQAARSLVMQAMENACRDVDASVPPDTLYFLVMADDLALQHDANAIRKQYGAIWTPMLALRMVAYIRSLLLPKIESRDAIAQLPAAVQRGIDEAALLFFTVEGDERQAWSIVRSDGQPSRAALRGAFAARMATEKRDLELLDQLFQPTGDAKKIHHDGITLRNALGRTFDDLLASEEMQYPVGMSELPPAHQSQLLVRWFAQSNLSTRYPFGSVRHAIATTIERIAHYRGDPIPDDLDTDTCLLNAFKEARLAWTDADEGPSSADLLMAGQLAASNEVRLESTATLRTWFDAAIVAPFRRVSEQMRTEGAQGTSPIEWLQQSMQQRRDENRAVPRSAIPYEYQWALDTIRGQKERIAMNNASYFFFDHYPESGRVMSNFIRTPQWKARSLFYARAFLNVDPAALKHEILLGNTWQERGEASLVYANERMLATFGNAPTLDLVAIAVDTLRAAGLNAPDIHATRRIEIAGSDTELREPIIGSYVDAFLQVCRQVSTAQHFFLPSGKIIRPLEQLGPAVDAFNARLPSDPWIRAAALEHFRGSGTVPSARALQQAIEQKVRQHRIPSVSEILIRDVLDIRNLIPFYAASKAIQQGFQAKRYYQVLFGVITLVSDVASVIRAQPNIGFPRSFLTAIRRAPGERRGSVLTLSDGVSSLCGWPPSLAAFKDLKPWQELTGPPERLFDADLRLLPVNDRRPAQQLSEAVLPWGARGPIARARNGEADVKWNGFDVIFCRDENTVFLARRTRAEHYMKVDWLTLQPIEPPEFIHEGKNGEFQSLGASLPPLPPLFGDTLLADRPTVTQVIALLSNATDTGHRDFRHLFETRFDIDYTPAAQAFRQNHPSRAYSLLDLLENAYTHSAIVRRVFHQFMDTPMDGDAIPVSVDHGVMPMTSVSRTTGDVITTINAVVLPVDRDDASLRFQSVRGAEPPALLRTVLHEFFHAWTRLPDPGVAEERYHRGAVVWLSEAALRQMAQPVHPRIAYGLWDERVAATSEAYRNTILWSGLEDRLIGQLVPDLGMFDTTAMVYGVPTDRRVTISQVLSLLPAIAANADGDTAAAVASSFDWRFRISDARPGATPAQRDRFDASMRTLVQHCATHSPLLQRLLAAHPDNATEEWQFRIDVIPAEPEKNAQQLYEVNFLNRQVTLLSGMAHYLSHNGIRPLTMEMRILDATIARLTEATAPTRQASLYTDRGAVAWLTDHILAQSGYDLPRRLHRALLYADYGRHSRQAMEEFARARWAAEIEDRYLAHVLAL